MQLTRLQFAIDLNPTKNHRAIQHFVFLCRLTLAGIKAKKKNKLKTFVEPIKEKKNAHKKLHTLRRRDVFC